MLIWNCFRLLTSKFTTISFTMPLKQKYPFLLWKHENLASIFFTLDEQHIHIYLTFLTIQTMWKLVSYHPTISLIISNCLPITSLNIEQNLTNDTCHFCIFCCPPQCFSFFDKSRFSFHMVLIAWCEAPSALLHKWINKSSFLLHYYQVLWHMHTLKLPSHLVGVLKKSRIASERGEIA